MNREETINILEYLKSTKVGFYLKSERAWSSWLRKLERYSHDEVMSSVEYLEDNTTPDKHALIFGSPEAIRLQCDRSRARQERNKIDVESEQHLRRAELSFANIPGKNRTEQVVYVQANRSAEHYRAGETDNDYFNMMLNKAKLLGHEFAGVDYEKIKNTNVEQHGFGSMIRDLPW